MQPQSPTLAHGAKPGISIASLTATHRGIGNNPSITYSIPNATADDTIIVENNTIKTNQPIDFYILKGSYTFTLRAMYRSGLGSIVQGDFSFTLSVLAPTGPVLGTSVAAEEIQLYPNPAKRQLRLSFPPHHRQRFRIDLISAKGQLLRRYRRMTSEGSLILVLPEDHTATHYVIRIDSEQLHATRRIILR